VQTAGTGLQRVAASTAQARFVLEVDPVSSRTLHGRIETEGECPLPWRLEKPQRDADAELIGCLQRTRRNVAYEEALAALADALQQHGRPA
jgi:hypothetical protein